MANKQDVVGLADELGIIRAKMANLKDRETEIRNIMLESGVKAMEDKKFRAVVVESLRTNIDWKAVAAKLKPSRQLVTAHTTEKEVISIRVNARRGALVS
jgi:RNA-binding protein YlmH